MQDDARDSLKEAILYFYQLEDASDLNVTPPSNLFSGPNGIYPDFPLEWTTRKDTLLLQIAETVDHAIDAAVKQIRDMKWELVSRAIHFESTSKDLEDTCQNRFREFQGIVDLTQVPSLDATPDSEPGTATTKIESRSPRLKPLVFQYPSTLAPTHKKMKRRMVGASSIVTL